VAPDDPLSALLPKPPLPRPDRREAAIGDALRQFDGTDEAPSASSHRPGTKPTWLAAAWRRPQFGTVLAAVIVGMIVLPLWTARDRRPELAGPAATTIEAERASPARGAGPGAPSPSARLDGAPVAADRDTPLVAAPPPRVDQDTAARQTAKSEAPPQLADATAAASEQEDATAPALRRTAPSSPPAMVRAESATAPAPSPPAAPTLAESRRERDNSNDEVVVTAKRMDSAMDQSAEVVPRRLQARQASRPGDWNACTVNDPARSLKNCRGSASETVAQGLVRAWQGDLDGAIDRFDQAIAASPQSGLAYLNRGLAYERKGEGDRALADLDRAVRQMPNSARAYYNRSLLLGRRGERDRAEADAARAMELDSGYRAVIR
jgi:hypothetical protein